MISNQKNILTEAHEERQKPIYAQALSNYFRSIDHILQTIPSEDIRQLSSLRGFYPKRAGRRVGATKKWLFHAWSAEYTLQTAVNSTDKNSQKYTLNYIFQQAYYSVLYSSRAFFAIQGIEVSSEAAVRKFVNGYVTKGWYPEPIGLYINGLMTYFELISQFKISNPQQEECLEEADIDVLKFQQSLINIVKYLNFVHECYAAKVMGLEAYLQWIKELPSYLGESFLKQRYENGIIPVVTTVSKVEVIEQF
jgi:uncharacterized protein (UPF0332 family)